MIVRLACLITLLFALPAGAADRPNVLWITSEDNGPHLGCYGDTYATTPHLDELARKGCVYRYCWSTAPVCAPARTTIISGLYPPSTGSQHMRSMTVLPTEFRMYPQYLRDAGYYCTNNSKEDYNLEKPGQVWDESSGKAHWKKRSDGQPFFAIFNHTISHESKLRTRPHQAVHDPAGVRVPAYHPDTPEVRQDWAQYYDRLTEMDTLAGKNLDELESAGLADDTIVLYYGDHGSGMPRSKRWTYNSGLHVPLIVYIPEKYKHLRPADYQAGGTSDRLVGFIDLAPTLLSLAGIQPPAHLQGHAFLGRYATDPQPYQFGFRGRMDERYDMVRSVRDQRYIYIRNYMPHRIYGQYIDYMFQTPTTSIWKKLFDAGQLNEAQQAFWKTKPAEELYDLQTDPDEIHNLADSPEHREVVERMRAALKAQMTEIRDLGFLPEHEIHARSSESTPYEMGHDDRAYPFERIRYAAELAAGYDAAAVGELSALLSDRESAVRYWAAQGLLIRGADAVKRAHDRLVESLGDRSRSVRIVAAEALGRYGSEQDRAQALAVLMDSANQQKVGLFHAMQALNSIDYLDRNAMPAIDQIRELPRQSPNVNRRLAAYVSNLIKKTLADLDQ